MTKRGKEVNEVISTDIVLLQGRMWLLWLITFLLIASTGLAVICSFAIARQARWTRNLSAALSAIITSIAVWVASTTLLVSDIAGQTIALTPEEKSAVTSDQTSIGIYLPDRDVYTEGQHFTVARNGRDVCSMTVTDAAPLTRYLKTTLTCVIER